MSLKYPIDIMFRTTKSTNSHLFGVPTLKKREVPLQITARIPIDASGGLPWLRIVVFGGNINWMYQQLIHAEKY